MKIKQLCRYLLPVFVLPILNHLFRLISNSIVNTFGYVFLNCSAIMNSMNSYGSNFLYVIMLTALVVSAMLSEAGKVQKAKKVHCVLFIVFSVIFLMKHLAFIFAGDAIAVIYANDSDILHMMKDISMTFSPAVLTVSLLGGLIAQLVKKYSMIFTLCFLGGLSLNLTLLYVIIVRIFDNLFTIFLFEGIQYAITNILPFVMIPIASYSSSFADLKEQ